ncbi:MAG: DUF4259 domain-containing protein [Methyloligellaceae bacterium]
MGTFGGGSFENDVALDFAASVVTEKDIASVFSALPEDPAETIDAEEAQKIIAAAECIAAMMGRPEEDIPGELKRRLEDLDAPDADLIETARNAVYRVLSRSELLDLWAESDAQPFNLAITRLIDRLNPSIAPRKKSRKKNKPVLQICSFCDREVELEDLYSFEIRQVEDAGETGSGLNRGAWCHLSCLNERLHPKHLVQNWKFDPEEIQRQADEILNMD